MSARSRRELADISDALHWQRYALDELNARIGWALGLHQSIEITRDGEPVLPIATLLTQIRDELRQPGPENPVSADVSPNDRDGFSEVDHGDRDRRSDRDVEDAASLKGPFSDATAGSAVCLDVPDHVGPFNPVSQVVDLPGVMQLHVHVHLPSSVADTQERTTPAASPGDPAGVVRGDRSCGVRGCCE